METTQGMSEFVIDRERAKEDIGCDDEFLDEVLLDFAGEVGISLENIDAACDAGDWRRIGEIAHSVKGSAATLCCIPLSKASKQLEDFGYACNDTVDRAMVNEMITNYRKETDRLFEYVMLLERSV